MNHVPPIRKRDLYGCGAILVVLGLIVIGALGGIGYGIYSMIAG